MDSRSWSPSGTRCDGRPDFFTRKRTALQSLPTSMHVSPRLASPTGRRLARFAVGAPTPPGARRTACDPARHDPTDARATRPQAHALATRAPVLLCWLLANASPVVQAFRGRAELYASGARRKACGHSTTHGPTRARRAAASPRAFRVPARALPARATLVQHSLSLSRPYVILFAIARRDRRLARRRGARTRRARAATSSLTSITRRPPPPASPSRAARTSRRPRCSTTSFECAVAHAAVMHAVLAARRARQPRRETTVGALVVCTAAAPRASPTHGAAASLRSPRPPRTQAQPGRPRARAPPRHAAYSLRRFQPDPFGPEYFPEVD